MLSAKSKFLNNGIGGFEYCFRSLIFIISLEFCNVRCKNIHLTATQTHSPSASVHLLVVCREMVYLKREMKKELVSFSVTFIITLNKSCSLRRWSLKSNCSHWLMVLGNLLNNSVMVFLLQNGKNDSLDHAEVKNNMEYFKQEGS